MDVRPSPIAGQWYPGDARTLGDEVDRHLTAAGAVTADGAVVALIAPHAGHRDRKSTRLNSSHLVISYAVFCLKKKKKLQCTEGRGPQTLVRIRRLTTAVVCVDA